MNGPGLFLAGAQSRLLPFSLPFRFFGAAAVYHIAFWALLAWAAEDLPAYRGGPGPLLAAIHLLTLGVLTMTAVGASLQLLPVATRRPVGRLWPCRLLSWLLIPGVGLLAAGMALPQSAALAAGGAATAAALALYALLIAGNLRGAKDFRLVRRYGWLALVALMGLLLLGLLLAADFHHGFLPDHGALAATHLVVASYGFMGSLALGFSFVLVPMFALARGGGERLGPLSFVLTLAALALAVWGLAARQDLVVALAAALGLGGAGCYLAAMAALLRSGMRQRLGLSFVLIRAAWAMLPLSLLLGAGLALGLEPPAGAGLFGLALLPGWLLTFLLGVLQRIAPFLASMHSTRGGGRAARPSDLTAEGLLRIHAVCHGGALLLLAAGLLADSALTLRLGALLGLAGALAFAGFLAAVPLRLTRRSQS